MAAKGTTYANSWLQLLFNAVTFANVAQNASSSPISNIYVGLATASPGASGNQTTNEATYGSYARVGVVRTSSGWVVSSNSCSPQGNIVFPTSTGTPSETETFVIIGSSASGAGTMFYYGPISPTITMNAAGITPSLTTASTVTET